MANTLSQEHLLRFERALRIAQPETLAFLDPGPSEDEVGAALAPLGLVPSGEALTWWTWRTPQAIGTPGARIGSSSLLTLQQGIAEYQSIRKLDDELEAPATLRWPSDCVPFMVGPGGDSFCMRLDGRSPTEVLGISHHDDVYPHRASRRWATWSSGGCGV